MAAIAFACGNQQKPRISVKNAEEYALAEKAVVLQRADIENAYGNIDTSLVVFLKDSASGELLPCQLDDIDNDGKWDELFSQVSLEANESKSFYLELIKPSEAPEVKVRTNVRFANIDDASNELYEADRLTSTDTETSQKYFQFEGPSWENDIIGFRNYFDFRNGMDIWGKTSSEMVLDSVGIKGAPSYHEMQPWGMDILKVANSLGAGAIALETATGLHRVGPCSNGTFKLISEGPLRSIIDFDYDGIELDGNESRVEHRVIIVAGKPWYESLVKVTDAATAKVVTGIVNLHSDTVYSGDGNGFAYMFTHDNQAYAGEKLGMAVILPQCNIEVFTAPEEGEGITQTFYTKMEQSDEPCRFFFMAGWEPRFPEWADKDAFEQGVIEQGKFIAANLEVTIVK